MQGGDLMEKCTFLPWLGYILLLSLGRQGTQHSALGAGLRFASAVPGPIPAPQNSDGALQMACLYSRTENLMKCIQYLYVTQLKLIAAFVLEET